MLTVLVTDTSPSLADALTGLAARQVVKGPPCSVVKLIADLESDPKGKQAFLDVIDTDVSAAMIADALSASGHRIAEQTLRRHRKRQRAGGCLCPR